MGYTFSGESDRSSMKLVIDNTDSKDDAGCPGAAPNNS